VLRYRQPGDTEWSETRMQPLVNDRWIADFRVDRLGTAFYTLEAWVDRFLSWRHDTGKKVKAGQDVSVELLAGAQLIADAARRARGEDARLLSAWADTVARADLPPAERAALALGDE